MQTETIALWLAGIGVIGLACQWFAWRLKLPAILFASDWLASARDSFGRFAFSYGVISGRCDSV